LYVALGLDVHTSLPLNIVWSNFEIADMNFWRGEAYTAFFDYLDKTGNFYYERWGDAPVHSIAAALFSAKSQIHFFDEIGYEHNPYTHCPSTAEAWKRGKCGCDQKRSFGECDPLRTWDVYFSTRLKRLQIWMDTHV
jgi:hypothetical protein